MTNQATFALIEECRAALAEELSAWDIDPPLHHVKQAHDKCVAWLATQPAPQPEAQASPAPAPLSEEQAAAIFKQWRNGPLWLHMVRETERAHGIGLDGGM